MALPFDTSLEGKRIFLRVGPTDFRRGVRGMVSLVVGAMNMSMDGQSMFVFCSTSKKQIRIVYCEGAGCWMLTRSIRYGCVFGQEKLDKMVVGIPYFGTVRKYSLLPIFQYPPSLS